MNSLNIKVTTRMAALVGAPEQFTSLSDDWEFYIQRFEHFLLVNKIDGNDEKCHLLLALMGASTFKLLASLIVPKLLGQLKFVEICEKLKRYFLPKQVKIAERYRFCNRRQHLEESAAEYLAELRKMVSTCEFGAFLEEALCNRFV